MKQKVALVLSGGGARGIAHIGVIEEIEKRGYEISSIAGTSMGAVVGGMFVLGKIEEFKKWMFTLDKLKVFNLVDFSFGTPGLIKGDRVLNKMKEIISDANIEELKIPYAAVAVDLIDKKEVVFTSGSIYDAIRASIAIPTVLTPVKKGKALLVDGGVLNNIPVNHVKRTEDDILIAVNVNAKIPVYKPTITKKESDEKESIYLQKIKIFQNHLHKILPSSKEEKLGYFDVLTNTINLMTYHFTQFALEMHSPDILINVSHDSCGTFDFYRSEEQVEIGRHAAIRYLDEYENQK